MKLTSVDTLIYRIQRFVLDPINKADCYEWIGRAMSKIGGEIEQVIKTTGQDGVPPLVIKDNQADLPCDFVQFIRFLELTTDENIPLVEYPAGWVGTQMMYANRRLRINEPGFTNVYNGPNNSYNPRLHPNVEGTQFTDLDYSFGNNIIKFKVKEGTMVMQYWALPTDKAGLPLIPDEEEYAEALQWYCLWQMSMGGMVFRDKTLTTAYLKQEWGNSCLNARAYSRMPDKQALERLKNEATRLLPILNHYETSFKYLGTKEQLVRHGRY